MGAESTSLVTPPHPVSCSSLSERRQSDDYRLVAAASYSSPLDSDYYRSFVGRDTVKTAPSRLNSSPKQAGDIHERVSNDYRHQKFRLARVKLAESVVGSDIALLFNAMSLPPERAVSLIVDGPLHAKITMRGGDRAARPGSIAAHWKAPPLVSTAPCILPHSIPKPTDGQIAACCRRRIELRVAGLSRRFICPSICDYAASRIS